MPGPALPLRQINPQTIQVSARVSLKSMHDLLRKSIRFHNRMNVIRPNMSRKQEPASVQTDFAKSSRHSRTAIIVRKIKRLVHQQAFHFHPLRFCLRQSASGENRIRRHAAAHPSKRK